MAAIILEDVLFLALIAAVLLAIVVLVRDFTPLGLRLRQSRNRRALEDGEALTCPVHGPQQPGELVRLDDGRTCCPHCYREVLHGDVVA